MARRNGKSEVEPRELDAEHELPAAENEDDGPATQGTPETSVDSESQRLKAERDSLIDRMARMQADFDNARKRAAREQQDFKDYAVADAIKALLPVLDSFERALHAGANEKSELRSGVELIYRQLQDALGRLGVQAVPAAGQPFDPRFHEAIEMVDTEQAPDHQVLEELQPGYKLKDRLLRPAMVRVARNSRH
jgi:molecular chaperone GrpE